jgi:DeoR/GlpR family transcriptional regulator of sugar metabolism
MQLTAKALKKVNTVNIRRELSGILQCTEQTIIRYIKKNEKNGMLTTMAAIDIIKKMTLLKEKDILRA